MFSLAMLLSSMKVDLQCIRLFIVAISYIRLYTPGQASHLIQSLIIPEAEVEMFLPVQYSEFFFFCSQTPSFSVSNYTTQNSFISPGLSSSNSLFSGCMLTLHWTVRVTTLLSLREELDLQEKESFQRVKFRGGLWGNHLANGCVGAVFCSRKSVLYKETWPKSCHQGRIVKTWKSKQCWTEEKCDLFLVLLPCTVGIWNRHSVKMSKRDGIKYSAFLEGSFFLTCGNRGSLNNYCRAKPRFPQRSPDGGDSSLTTSLLAKHLLAHWVSVCLSHGVGTPLGEHCDCLH